MSQSISLIVDTASETSQDDNRQPTYLIKRIEQIYSRYLANPLCVYKICVHPTGQWIVIMRKTVGLTGNNDMTNKKDDYLTRCNENRQGVNNPKYAKFRASTLLVLKIFDANDVERTIDCLEHESIHSIAKTIYKVGMMVRPDNFDEDPDEVCSTGIHYFKSIKAAFWYRDQPDDYTGKWTTYGECGRKHCSIFVKNGMRHGKYRSFHENGTKESEIYYVNGEKSGHCIDWNEHGTKEREGDYVDDFKYGEWIYHHDTIDIKHDDQCDDRCDDQYDDQYDDESDTVDNFDFLDQGSMYDSGLYKHRCVGEYVDEQKSGHWIYYYNENKFCEGSYDQGKRSGKWTFWSEMEGKDVLSHEGTYVNGIRDGEWIYRDTLEENCPVILRGNFCNGKKNGIWTSWDCYSNGMDYEGTYESGVRHGPWKKWDEGVLKCEGMYANNVRTGIWTYYGKQNFNEPIVEQPIPNEPALSIQKKSS